LRHKNVIRILIELQRARDETIERQTFRKESINPQQSLCFVAERRRILARPFKAGINEANRVTSRQRRLTECSAVADATMFGNAANPGLERPG